jgi:alkylation response protein AidB-like acyl-CoA dehydrogenase
MDLTHTPERAALAESVRALLVREWPTSVVRELQATPTGFHARRWKQARELGWTAIPVPEDRGGLGGGFLDLVVVVEELGRAAASLPLVPTVAHGVLPALWSGADLAGLVSGETIAVPAVLEADGRTEWPVHAATRDGAAHDGSWRLSGAKTMVPFAEVADRLLVTTRLDGPGDAVVSVPTGGVPMRRLRLPVGDPVYRVDLDGIRVTEADLVAIGAAAREAHSRATAVATLLACGYTVGLCETALRIAVEHAKERVQFGRPIGAFQSVANRCADMRVQTDAFRWLTYEAAWTSDQGLDAALAVATAKAYGDLTVRTVTRDAHQVVAGMGISTEHDLHLFTRRARTFAQTGGSLTGHLHRVADLIGL